MKNFAKMLFVAILGGATSLGTYHYFEDGKVPFTTIESQPITTLPVTFKGGPLSSTNADFTEAADRTVHAVVHVKNVQVARRPRNMQEYFHGGGEIEKGLAGTGSGVVISQDGYIVTNNHVIDGASELEVTMNDNQTYTAKVIGADPKADIALLKIEAEEDLPYLPFGDSEATRLGEWVLAVGNPFNLTSTVTAGIISAKARDLGEFSGNPSSFIQTDAAINPGNSGGALVNINGELIGINTAITSQTGSYVGYAFAVPSNLARKIVEDIMEYGNVQRGILGVSGTQLNPTVAEQIEISESQGFYVGGVEPGSGAEKAGLKKGDIIKKVDEKQITKFADLSGYLNTKRPDDKVQVEFLRDGKLKTLLVTLYKLSTYKIEKLGVEVKDIAREQLKDYDVSNGVVINNVTREDLARYDLKGVLISEIDGESVKNIEQIQRFLKEKSDSEPISITFVWPGGEQKQIIFQ
ncbi:trypsin-like peptidase domain-containing protein [Flavimarina sp. Hel_I_48]|uniref:trypsin-like peptidase domain-containing protein n=1 Tax=Flavimarina sp. Hel_I_48 TaxID=1392488 RepID=UPI0004DFB1B4|nr:trypsin-like peptidase domain-containing protein [Flavimarina sp. Hel_I_48]